MSWREALKKPAAKPAAPKPKFDTKDDDWDTDITQENQSTEKSQRYGSASVPGSGRVDHVDLNTIRDKVKIADETAKEAYKGKNPNRGYGGKYGTEQVMDKVAEDFSYKADIKKHSSQTDSKKGFGGEFGVDERAKDKSAVGFDYKPTVEKHSSQTDSKKGFGGEFGIDERAKDTSAVGFDYKPTAEKHSSQKDYTAGFGGKYGVQKEETSSPSVAPLSPKPVAEPKVVEKTATPATPTTPTTPATPTSVKTNVGGIRARFENLKKEKEEEAAQRVAEERKKRAAMDQKLQESQPTIDKKNQTKVEQKEAPEEPTAVQVPENEELTPAQVQENEEPTLVQVPENEESTSSLNENEDKDVENVTITKTEENQANTETLVGGINVASILRQRKTSSASSKNDDDDDEWAADKN